MAIPMRLSCQLCEWQSRYDTLPDVMALYLFHMITDHYDIVEKVHKNPELLEAIQKIL